MSKIRPFEKSDWYGFSGATSGPDKPPCIRDEAPWLGISDVIGIEIYIDGDFMKDIDDRIFRYDCSYEMGKLILENLPEELNPDILKDLGFKEA